MASGQNPGLNHPVTGSTTLVNDTWYHAAATYDGVTWRLYVNGQPDGQLTVNRPTRADSIQHAAVGTAMNSTGAAAGSFNGIIDEVRIWSVARTSQDIRATHERGDGVGAEPARALGFQRSDGNHRRRFVRARRQRNNRRYELELGDRRTFFGEHRALCADSERPRQTARREFPGRPH